MTTDQPKQRPEGKLIEEAQKRSGRSIRHFAAFAEISEARWRQLVKGSLKAGSVTQEQVAPAYTLARMALAVGVTPEQLTAAGRGDAAMLMATATQSPSGGPPSRAASSPAAGSTAGDDAPSLIDQIYGLTTLTVEEKLRAIGQVVRLHAQAEAEKRGKASQSDTEVPD